MLTITQLDKEGKPFPVIDMTHVDCGKVAEFVNRDGKRNKKMTRMFRTEIGVVAEFTFNEMKDGLDAAHDNLIFQLFRANSYAEQRDIHTVAMLVTEMSSQLVHNMHLNVSNKITWLDDGK